MSIRILTLVNAIMGGVLGTGSAVIAYVETVAGRGSLAATVAASVFGGIGVAQLVAAAVLHAWDAQKTAQTARSAPHA